MSLDFEQFIKQNMKRIRRVSERYAAPGEVEDLFQEISMALWRSHDKFRGESTAETWLYRIAFNTAMTRVRKTIREREGNVILSSQTRDELPGAEGMSQADILTSFLESLGEIDASVLMMYLDGLSTDDMKLVLGISVSAINVRVSRIKDKFSKTYVD